MKKLLGCFILLVTTLFWTILVQSCAQYETPERVSGPAFIEVSPFEITAGSGEVHTIWVIVLDGAKNAVPNVLVHAVSDTPSRVLVQPESLLTDKEGKAVFTANAITHFPGTAYIIFTADGLSTKVETIYIHM
ncbi:MAG: hypothetical protein ACYSRP_06595 [Planctomycetota bacterium]|jgi:hypothetical protein